MSTLTQPQSLHFQLPLEAIAVICLKYDVATLSVFGSILRDDFRPDSDIDFLVQFRNNDAGPWMGKYMDMERDLSELLKRKVDLVSRAGLEQSENYLRRRHILGNERVIYVA